VRASHCEDVAGAAFLQRGAQPRVAAVDFISRDPDGLVAGVQESGDHASGQFWLGRELRLVTESGGPAAVGVGGPGTRNIEFPVYRGVPAAAGVDQVDGDLGVLDPACGAGVLALDTDGVGAL